MHIILISCILGILLSSCKKDEDTDLQISGTVSDPETGAGVAGASVTLESKDLSGSTFNNTFMQVDQQSTASDGGYDFVFQRRTSAEYRLTATKTGHFGYESIINPDALNDGPYTENIALPSRAWFSIHITNVSPFDGNDELVYQLTMGYPSNCPENCCGGTIHTFNGMNVDTVITCLGYGNSTLTWTAISTKDGVPQTFTNQTSLTPYDTTSVDFNY